MDLGLSGRRALVCGGSRGIGYAAALRLAQEGARVVIVARSPASLEEAAESLRARTGCSVECIAADLGTPAGRAAVVAACPETDVLVTHSGIPQRFAEFTLLSRQDWDWWFDAHFHSAMDLIRAYVPGMKERRFGRIVNVSANFIKFPQARAGHSHGTRLALAGAIAALVRELAPYDVTINSVRPGLVDTQTLRAALQERAGQRGVDYGTVEAEVISRCPAGRIADAGEIGDLITMLASARLGYMTGRTS